MTERCTCCGQGGRGFWRTAPRVWGGCQCLSLRRCPHCACCYEHCRCVSLEQRLAALDREDLLVRRSVDEARCLFAALSLKAASSLKAAFAGSLNEEALIRIGQTLRARAFRRYCRRLDQLHQVTLDRELVGRRRGPDAAPLVSEVSH